MEIIDVNTAFGFWPAQRFTHETVESFEDSLRRGGVGEIWVSAVESILYPEPDTFDFRLFERFRSLRGFRPVKTVNPLLANWKERTAEAHEKFRIAAIKVFANYHGYSLNDPLFNQVCMFAEAEGLPVLIALRVNDERNQPSFLQVAPVPVAQVVEASRRFPGVPFIALCSYRNELPALADGGENLLVDLSFQDGAGMVENAVCRMGASRVVFGSHEAFLHAQAALLKLRHSRLSEEIRLAIASGNVRSRLQGRAE